MLAWLKQKFSPPPKAALAPPTTNAEATEFLAELFAGHGAPCRRDGAWIVGPHDCLRAQARLLIQAHPTGRHAVQLDVECHARDGAMILESCAGFGTTSRDAVSDAFRSFCDGAFHVFYAAFTGGRCSHCDVEQWTIAGRPRDVFLGSITTRHTRADQDQIPGEWFEQMKEAILALPLDDATHAIRFYHGEFHASPAINEVLLDNADCPPLLQTLTTYAWPRANEFYSVRLFLIIRLPAATPR